MIDLHIHILPGIDDGPSTVEQAVDLARACAEDGVMAVAATPHVSEAYPTRPEPLQAALDVVRAAVDEAGVHLQIFSGAEIAIDRMHLLSDDELRRLTLGGAGRTILLECPYAAWPMDLETQLGRLATLGIRAMLAHPERSRGVQEDGGVDHLATAVARGMLVQMNAGSLSGRFGRSAAHTARRLLDDELVHVIASDAHNTDRRPPRMSEAAREVHDEALAEWLTTTSPGAILRGDRIPPRPERVKKRRGLFGRRR